MPIKIEGLDELRAALKGVDSGLDKALAGVYPVVSKEETTQARLFAVGTSAQAGHFASSIRSSSSTHYAAIGVVGPGTAAIFGSKKHTGWYAQPKYDQSKAGNNPTWVGTSWEVGGPGGPIGINDAVRFDKERIVSRFEDAVIEAFGPFFKE